MQYQHARTTETRNKGTITVTAEGEYEAQPDRATIRLGTSTESKDLRDAQARNSEAISKVIASLIENGIPKDNIKTVDYRIEPMYQYENGIQNFIGYKVIHLLSVENHDIQKTGYLVDTAVSTGANLVESIVFTSSKADQFYHFALSSAMIVASQKAMTISRTLNVTLDPIPLKVIEKQPIDRPLPYQALAIEKASADTPIQPGKMTISATIEAIYQYL